MPVAFPPGSKFFEGENSPVVWIRDSGEFFGRGGALVPVPAGFFKDPSNKGSVIDEAEFRRLAALRAAK